MPVSTVKNVPVCVRSLRPCVDNTRGRLTADTEDFDRTHEGGRAGSFAVLLVCGTCVRWCVVCLCFQCGAWWVLVFCVEHAVVICGCLAP